MSQTLEIEARLSRVERELTQLKSEVHRLGVANNWIDQVRGSFKDDPEYDEVLRLGRELRQAESCQGE